MGARPLGRLIQDVIKKPLAEEVLFGKLQKGGIVRVTVEDKEDGQPGLKLDSIPDENATRKEKPAGPVKAEDAEPDADAPDGTGAAPSTRPPRGGGSVPRVPMKV
jgi:ATP-dependent Clp protease ATP-binding subunit ClpA